ncbi:NADPH2:quinone reductase [Collimonas sp. OK607]|nr:NADPH2:quinone reductase [Collimonas sp. OK607]
MTYHRVRTYEPGAPAVMRYETVPGDIGAPGPGQVRLRQEAAGLNFIESAGLL